MNSKTIVVIPARFKSSRFPGKPLTLIAGHPMIEWVYRRASRARAVDAVLVATDDARIESAVKAFGGKVIMTSSHHSTGTDRIAEAARKIKAGIFVNVQGDEPLIDPRAIDLAVRGHQLSGGKWPVTTLKTPIRRAEELVDPNVVKVVTNAHHEALYFSRSAIPCLRDKKALPKNFLRQRILFKHLGLYVYSRAFLLRWPQMKSTPLERSEALEQLRVLENGYRIKVLETSFSSPSVDTPDDVGVVEEEIARRKIRF